MYDHLFTPPSSRLKQPIEDTNKQYGIGNQINKSSVVQEPSRTDFGVSVNKISNSIPDNLNNDYLLNQKLRNIGMYSQLKNKTIYSQSALAHASLNSGLI